MIDQEIPLEDPADPPPSFNPTDPQQREELVDRIVDKLATDPDYHRKVLAEVWVMLFGFEQAMREFSNMGPADLIKMMTGGKTKKRRGGGD
jgi:hypothetical protein